MPHSGPLKSPLPFLPGTIPSADGPDSFSCVFEAILESHRAKAPPTPASPHWRPWPHLARPRAPFSPLSCLPNPLPPGLIHLLLLHLLLLNRILVPALLLMGLGHREGRKRRQRLEPSRPQGGIPLVPATQKTALDWGQHPWAGE